MTDVLKKLIIGLLLFSLVAGIFITGITMISEDYDVDLSDSGLNKTWERSERTINRTKQMQSKIFNESELSEDNAFGSTWKGAWASINLAFGSIGTASALLSDIIIQINPVESGLIIGVLVAILIVMILFSLFYLISGRNK